MIAAGRVASVAELSVVEVCLTALEYNSCGNASCGFRIKDGQGSSRADFVTGPDRDGSVVGTTGGISSVTELGVSLADLGAAQELNPSILGRDRDGAHISESGVSIDTI